MDDSCASDSPEHTTPSVTSILGIKGGLRFRAHGSTQKAHLVLRRVIVSDDSGDDISDSKIVRFALIAHKRIEVKPGKELLLMLESESGPFKDRPVVFEGDLKASEDTSDIDDDEHTPDEEVFVPPVQVMPPKLRKTWSKKVDDVIPPATPQERPSVALTSIGIQTEPPPAPFTQEFKDMASQTSAMAKSLSVQVDLPFHTTASPIGPTSLPPTSQTESTSTEYNYSIVNGGPAFSSQKGDKRERSLSPMELDSPSVSPQNFPLPLSSAPVPELLPLPPSSPIYSPTLSIASSSGAQDMELSPILSRSPAKHDTLASVALERSTSGQGASTKSLAVGNSSADISATSKPQERGKKSSVPNPFVSGGFLTTFGASPEKPNGSTKTIKTETEDVELSPSIKPNAHAQSFSTPVQSEKESAGQMSRIEHDPIASSSSVQLSKVSNQTTDALEKLPAKHVLDTISIPPISNGTLSNPLGIRPSALLKTTNVSKRPPLTSSTKKRLVVGSEWRPTSRAPVNPGPVIDTPSAAPVTSGATTSTSILSQVTSYSSLSPPPTLPPASPTSVSPTKWKPVSSSVPPSPTTILSSVSKLSCPPSQNTDAKRSASDTPCPAPSDRAISSESSRRLQKSPLFEKARAVSFKDRLVPSPPIPPSPTASRSLKDRLAPLETALPTNASSDGTLLSRISDMPPPSSQPTPPISDITSPSPTLVSYSPALHPSTPSQSTSAKPVSPSISRSMPSTTSGPKASTSKSTSPVSSRSSLPTPMVHPLPMKPSTSPVTVKRERSSSPEPGSRKRPKRVYKWPTIKCNYLNNLAGEGPLGIRSIAFSSDGTLFALSCE
ncbi:hypothetical protein H0H92_012028 [Tricholoma furcatifolium]|nr:hypothetical protein H0H92_012028 [Tricholoma furcatifolium]